MRLGADAMNAALQDFKGLGFTAQVSSAYEVFITAKWIEAKTGALPAWGSVGSAVTEIFGVLPDDSLGRLAPFHFDWLVLKDSGRKTVWNNNTRAGSRKSQELLVGGDIRNGLKPDAVTTLSGMLPDLRPSWQSLAVLVLRNDDFPVGADWATAEERLLGVLGLDRGELRSITSDAQLGVPLLADVEWTPETVPEDLRPESAVTVPAVPSTASPIDRSLLDGEPTTIVVDSRVERMLRLALTAYQSVLLIGPPGTGKGTLLRWVLSDIAGNPTQYGFQPGFVPKPMWRTPDESWTSFDLVGGLAPDEHGVLQWSEGALLKAVAEDRWLILDETNRGDMDKIMGPLLTWLSRQEVEVGRTAAHGGSAIRLGWGEQPESVVVHDPEQRYLAGADWRLIGTYNPQDAQRVFRFGQALSRRFVVVPVPPVRPGQFDQLLGESFPTLGPTAKNAITGLYSAHLADELSALGPAVFLGMARYFLAGIGTDTVADAQSGDSEDAIESHEDPQAEVASELLAEAYVLGVGRYLAGLEDRAFDALTERVVNDEGVFSSGDWSWVTQQRSILS